MHDLALWQDLPPFWSLIQFDIFYNLTFFTIWHFLQFDIFYNLNSLDKFLQFDKFSVLLRHAVDRWPDCQRVIRSRNVQLVQAQVRHQVRQNFRQSLASKLPILAIWFHFIAIFLKITLWPCLVHKLLHFEAKFPIYSGENFKNHNIDPQAKPKEQKNTRKLFPGVIEK
jgi:hypothetical protein